MIRRLFTSLALTILFFAVAPVTLASAQDQHSLTCSSSTASQQQYNPIVSGLWAGVNLDFGGTYTVTGDKITATSCQTPKNTTPQTTTNAPNSPSTSTPQPAATHIYAALGDSVAAGVGLPSVSSVPSAETRCGRTQNAYPYEVARTLNLSLIHAACSGATVGDLFTQQRSGSPNLPPQLNAAFAQGTPRLITITAGANDAHWVQFIQTCYVTNCATATQTNLANAYLVALQAKLLVLFPDIQARSSGSPPKVLITGYYNPVSPACTTLSGNITAEEITWMTDEVNALNQTISNVTKLYSFAHFVPVDFTGHDVCSSDSWIQGLQDSRPFHPTATGQQVIAGVVIASYGL